MKKLLLTTAAISALSISTVMATAEDIFYLKANFGGTYLSEETDKATKLKLKSDNSYFFGVGVGYYFMDNLRADLVLDHYIDPKLKKSGEVTNSNSNVTSKHKAEINTLVLNGYIDLFDISVTKVFVGAGVGVSQLKEKIERSDGSVPDDNFSVNAKKNNNFTYAIHVGASTEFAPGVNGELSYSWKNFGKTNSVKSFSDNRGVEVGKTEYSGHHVVMGIRFDI